MYTMQYTRREHSDDDDGILYPQSGETGIAVDDTGRSGHYHGIGASAGRRQRVGVDEAAFGQHGRESGHNALTVDYAPGATSDPHVHPGSVFAYVLEGTVVTQLEGGQPMTYSKGQSWYESPKKPHMVSRNASVTEPAKLLVLLLSQEGEALKVPVK